MQVNIMSKSSAKDAAERLKNQTTVKLKESTKPIEGPEPVKEDGDVLESQQPAKEDDDVLEGQKHTQEDENLSLKDGNNSKLSQVEFIAPYKRYSKGDIAAFSPEIAKDLIDKKVAVLPGEYTETEQEPV
jgi:hypothetical protein